MTQLLARVEPAALPTQPFAVQEVSAGELHPDASPGEPLYRLAIEPLGGLAIAKERPRARLDAERPVRSTGSSVGREPPQGVGSRLRPPAPNSGLDELRQRQRGERQLVRLHAVLLSGDQRLLVAAQSVVEQRTRPPDHGPPRHESLRDLAVAGPGPDDGHPLALAGGQLREQVGARGRGLGTRCRPDAAQTGDRERAGGRAHHACGGSAAAYVSRNLWTSSANCSGYWFRNPWPASG